MPRGTSELGAPSRDAFAAEIDEGRQRLRDAAILPITHNCLPARSGRLPLAGRDGMWEDLCRVESVSRPYPLTSESLIFADDTLVCPGLQGGGGAGGGGAFLVWCFSRHGVFWRLLFAPHATRTTTSDCRVGCAAAGSCGSAQSMGIIVHATNVKVNTHI